VAEVMISLSKLMKENHRPLTKTIAVKSLDQLVSKNPKNPNIQTSEKMNQKKDYLIEQINSLENELKDLHNKKQAMIEKTEKEITKQRNAWEEERQSYVDAANKEGYETGFTTGEADSLAKYKQLIDQANDIIRSANEDYMKTIKQSDQTIIELAIYVAEKIIHQQLTINHQIITQIVQDAIEDLADQQEIKVFVSSKDYEHLLRQKKDLENIVDPSSKLFIMIDEQLDQGMCLIEYPTGKTDASITTQLELIENELLNISLEQNE